MDAATAPKAEGPKAKYKTLKKRHPLYDLEYWREIRALYEGGKALLRNREILSKLLPRHGNEAAKAWEERKGRAYYVNHFATVIDMLTAGLASDELRMKPPGTKEGEAPKLDPFWKDFITDCSPPAGERQSYHELMVEQARTALQLGVAWTLVDLPLPPEYVQPTSEADQKKAGQLNVYACQVAPECVINWYEGKDGRILWATSCFKSRHQIDPLDDRVTIREEYTTYTEEQWMRFVVDYDEDQNRAGAKKPPDDETVIDGVMGEHTFGRVPLVRMRIPPGMWMGNKLHSLAVEYLNKSCGISEAEKNMFFAQLYEFLGSSFPGVDEPINEHQADQNRAKNQPRGPDIVQVRGQDDKAAYVAPPSEGIEVAHATLKDLKGEMFRVTYTMALEENPSAAAIKRSAESKAIDHEVSNDAVVAVGRVTKKHAVDVVDTGATGRKDANAEGWTASGLEGSVDADPETLVEQAVALEAVTIPSATFKRSWALMVALALLREKATPDIVKAITAELDKAITQDQIQQAALAATDPPDEDEGDDDDPGAGGGNMRRGAAA